MALHTVRSGSGDPLVLIHGIGSEHAIWEPILPALADRHDVLAVDLPGCGRSAPPVGGPTLTLLAAAVAEELDRLGWASPHVVGNSLGGLIALELAAAGRARRVVALSPGGGQTAAEAAYTRGVLLAARGLAKVLGRRVSPLARSAAMRNATMWWSYARPADIPPQAAARMAETFQAATRFEATLFAMPVRMPARRLAQVTRPVLIAWGTKDRLLSPRGAHRLAADLPDAQVRLLDGLGHVPMWDDPDGVAGVVLDFLTPHETGIPSR